MPAEMDNREVMRRGRRMLLAENSFANALSTTMNNVVLTAMVAALVGDPKKGTLELGILLAAGYVGALGMLVTNPVLNRIGSRRHVCLVDLAVVRGLRVVVVSLLMLALYQVGGRSLLWPIMLCVCASSFFGWSAEIGRRSWISDLVPPAERGQFFARRVIIGTLTRLGVGLASAFVMIFGTLSGFTRDRWRR